jgi:purine-binding chemotaxis protein CheW
MAPSTRQTHPVERDSSRSERGVSQFIGFRLGDEDYAVAITKIQEIILMKPITRLPQAPDAIEGLINLRGSVIPVVNLRRRFGLPARNFDDETRTIVVNTHEKTVGCIVDEVTQVMRVTADQVQPVPVSVAALSRRYIAGIARLEDRLLIILDIDKLFDPSELDLGAHPQAPADPVPGPISPTRESVA